MSTQTKARTGSAAVKKNRPAKIAKAMKESAKPAANLGSREINLSGKALKWLIENTPIHPAAGKGPAHPPFERRDD